MIKGYKILGGSILALGFANTMAMAEPTVVILQSKTGPAAFIGTGTAAGAAMAFDEANTNGEFPNNQKVKVIVEDDATDRTQALALISRYGRDPDVKLILGPTSGAVALAGAQAANEIGVPVYTTTNNLEIPHIGPWSFISTQPPTEMMYYAANFAANSAQVKRCATVAIKEIEVYVALRQAYETWLREFGVEVVSSESISNNDIDFSALATKLAMQEIDCIFIASVAAQGGNIVRQLREAGLDESVKIFGMNTFSSPEFVQTGGPAVDGVYLMSDWQPGGSDDYSSDFAKRFANREGHDPDNWAALGFSIGRVAIEALKETGPEASRAKLAAALKETDNVKVVIGSGRYTLVDDRAPRIGSHVMQMQNGQAVMIEQAKLR